MLYPPPEFDFDIAKECASLVQQAYNMYADFKAKSNPPWTLPGNYNILVDLVAKPGGIFPPSEPFGFVALNKGSGNVFVVFRGTESIDDWITDLTINEIIDSPTNWGKTAKGFSDLYEQCSQTIHTAIKSAGSINAVFVTGHSLGGALAVLAMADLAISGGWAYPTMYSFAGPRVGDINFTCAFNDRFRNRAWRIVNTEDLVPTLPLSTPDIKNPSNPQSELHRKLAVARFNYLHVETSVCFTVNKGSMEDNHSMDLYQTALL